MLYMESLTRRNSFFFQCPNNDNVYMKETLERSNINVKRYLKKKATQVHFRFSKNHQSENIYEGMQACINS